MERVLFVCFDVIMALLAKKTQGHEAGCETDITHNTTCKVQGKLLLANQPTL